MQFRLVLHLGPGEGGELFLLKKGGVVECLAFGVFRVSPSLRRQKQCVVGGGGMGRTDTSEMLPVVWVLVTDVVLAIVSNSHRDHSIHLYSGNVN